MTKLRCVVILVVFALGYMAGGYIEVDRTLDNLCALKLRDLTMVCVMR